MTCPYPSKTLTGDSGQSKKPYRGALDAAGLVFLQGKNRAVLTLSRKNHFADLSPCLIKDVLDLLCLLVIKVRIVGKDRAGNFPDAPPDPWKRAPSWLSGARTKPLNRVAVLVQEASPRISYDVDLPVILLVHSDATLVLKHLQSWIDHACARGVAAHILNGLNNAISVERLVTQRHEYKKLDVAALHPQGAKLRDAQKLILGPLFPYSSRHDTNLFLYNISEAMLCDI